MMQTVVHVALSALKRTLCDSITDKQQAGSLTNAVLVAVLQNMSPSSLHPVNFKQQLLSAVSNADHPPTGTVQVTQIIAACMPFLQPKPECCTSYSWPCCR